MDDGRGGETNKASVPRCQERDTWRLDDVMMNTNVCNGDDGLRGATRFRRGCVPSILQWWVPVSPVAQL